MNADVFIPMKNLKFVQLSDNACINENFEGDNRIAILSEVVANACSFIETLVFPSIVVLKDLPTELSSATDNCDVVQTAFDSFRHEMESKAIEIISRAVEVNRLETELNAAKAQVESLAILVMEISEKLVDETKRNEELLAESEKKSETIRNLREKLLTMRNSIGRF